jgi:uncharacterized OB-fold protein
MVCEACGTVSDPVWSWCPDCGNLVRTDGEFDLAELTLGMAEPPGSPASREPFPTEWAISA